MKQPKIKKLDNGLTIVTIPTDSPSVTVMSLVNTGSRFEDPSNNGISHFLEHMCFKGTLKKSGKEIMRYLDGLGAETNAFTSYEVTGYYVKSITKHWKKTLNVVSDIYLYSQFPVAEMEKEKGVIIGEISMYEDMPMRQVHDIFMTLVYGNQPAGWSILGPRKNILEMTQDDFLQYHNHHYIAANTTIVVSGQVNQPEVIAEVSKRFKNINQGSQTKKQSAVNTQKKPGLKCEYKKTDQTHMIMGYTTVGFHHKDALALKICGALLGGGMSSRLFETLREDMGVGYYVHASNNTQSDTGILQISCGVDSTRVREVIVAIKKEIQNLQDELVSIEELKKTKEFIIGNTNMGLESTDDRAYYYGQRSMHGLLIQTPRSFAADIQSVTARDIRRVIRKYALSERLNLAMIGPHKDAENKLFMKAIKKTTN